MQATLKTLPLFLTCFLPVQAGLEVHANPSLSGPASFLLMGAALLTMYVTTATKTLGSRASGSTALGKKTSA